MRAPGPDALALLGRPTWRDVWFGAFLQWLIFVPLLGVLLTLAYLPGESGSVVLGLFSGLYSAPVGAVVTVALGVPLAKLLARVLRRIVSWRAHLAGFLGLGFVVATLLIHGWMAWQGHLFDSSAWWDSMPMFFSIASAAALSVGAGWGLAWRRAVRAEQKLLTLLES